MLDIPTQTGVFSLTGQEPHAKLSQNQARSKLAAQVLPVQSRLASIAAVINIIQCGVFLMCLITPASLIDTGCSAIAQNQLF